MATTVAAMKGKFGSTDYYILAMKASDLVANSIIPSEIPGWGSLSLEEKEQRDINYARVKKWIVPYLLSDKDRFFGALIMMAKNLGPKSFEPISDLAKSGLPRLYETQSQLMGFLTLTGGDLIPLDGQHRLKALQFAIEGVDEKGKPLTGVSPSASLPDEDVTVILIPYDDKKARRIFTKVNKYAKPTTTGQNLVTDDDDIIAVLSRKIANDHIGGADLVKYKGNTLSDKEGYFTTLSTLADCNVAILEEHFGEKLDSQKIDRTRPVDDARAMLYHEKVQEVWQFLIAHIDYFADALADKSKNGDANRCAIRSKNLLGKPVPQFCLVAAFARLTGPGTNLSYRQAAKKLNAVDWKKDAAEWDRLLMSGDKILTKNKKLVAEMLHYRLGGKLTEDAKEVLLNKYRAQFPADERDKKAKALPPLL